MKKFNKITKFLKGISSVICLFPQENTHKVTLPTASIHTSLKNDWEKIGIDMWQAYRTIESQQLEVKQHRSNNGRPERYPTQHR